MCQRNLQVDYFQFGNGLHQRIFTEMMSSDTRKYSVKNSENDSLLFTSSTA